MSTSSSSMNYQKHVKVKSRWLQSSQMEMIEESQSSLDMSDTITDVSTSDINESTDHSSEINSMELRRSHRTGNSRTDYKQLNGSKRTSQKTSTKKGHIKKQLLNTSEIGKKNKCKENISTKSNIHPFLKDCNNTSNFQSRRLSKSVNNINEIGEKLTKKSIRSSSLSWEFTFTPTNEVDSNNSILNKGNYYNISNSIKKLDLNETLLKNTFLNTDNYSTGKLWKDDKLTYKTSTTNEKNSQQLYFPNIRMFNNTNFNRSNKEVLNVELNDNCIVNSNKCEQSDVLIKHVDLYGSSELENLECYPLYKLRKIRSKSFDSFQRNTQITNNILRRCKSNDDIKTMKMNVDIHKFKISPKKSPKKKRRQSKRIKTKNNYIEIFDDLKVPEINYDQVADEIYKEHKSQLLEARMNDYEFDEKLKFTNFTLINTNIYRPNRQTLKLYSSENSTLRKLKQRVISGDINDYCECTLSKEDIIKGNTGCNDRCLNRLLKVECGSGCSLKRYCTNKQFQNKQFKKTNIIKTEKKGYGICAVEDIPKGVLISEYVGEVIDYNEMCNRLTRKEYKNQNYLVQLNPDEIIDSTSKGNITRFINHSCDPNAVGEKWCVLGQSRIGFFSTRDIKKNEEITFDYSFQIFGDDPQICYCGSSKCRGYISKAPQTIGLSSSDDSDNGGIENYYISKSEEKPKKKRTLKKTTAYNDKNKLRELRRQLTEIAKLKTGNKADQEMATLNLNRLMVHTTDSNNRLHVLKFIQEQDVNKRLFMDFSGLSIIHNWMTSNENESFKLMILDILTEFPITNRNTITKSKVLDVVAEWAKIPQDIKVKIERLEHPVTDLLKHNQEINSMFPTNNETTNSLVEKARDLWKKWIVLKMVFKIPKKIEQHKPVEEVVNSNKLIEDSHSSLLDITVLDRKAFRISNKYVNKERNQQTISLERMKLRKEYELKVEQEQHQMFQEKVMEDWHDTLVGVIKKIPDQNCFQDQQTLNLHNCNNSVLRYNNEIIKQSGWDNSTQVTCTNQNSGINYNISNPLNFITPQLQPINHFPQYSFMQNHTFSNYQSTYLNTSLSLQPNQPSLIKSQQYNILLNEPDHTNVEEPCQFLTKQLIKSAETNVFNLINESLHKHYGTNENKNGNLEPGYSNKFCSRAVQSGVDLLARIKVISNCFKNQPSKLIKIKHLNQNNGLTKLKKVPTSDIILKSVCDKNKKVRFINEHAGVSSNTCEKVMQTPTIVSMSKKNTFANSIFTPLLQKIKLEKDKLVPKTFILQNVNSDLITCCETNKELNLYKNMKPKKIKKVVSRVKTSNGFVTVVKQKWEIHHRNLKEKYSQIPSIKHNIPCKDNIHQLALNNCHASTTKSALKKQSSINANDYFKKTKEKRVTFRIEGETSPIFPHSELRPINLNQNIVKQKPLMKCHPFEVRNELKLSTSTAQDNLQLPFPEPESFETNIDHIITPIVNKFKASRSRRLSLRDKVNDLEQLRNQRKNMIPESMMSLSVDVLKLIPDNKKEMKKVIDYYHLMATIIVKILGSYAKKTCQQGRIRSDEDFKFLAKKINENVLLKELQIKKVDKLKITNNTKSKVAEYIKKYMSRFGEVYKRKPSEQTSHHNRK